MKTSRQQQISIEKTSEGLYILYGKGKLGIYEFSVIITAQEAFTICQNLGIKIIMENQLQE